MKYDFTDRLLCSLGFHNWSKWNPYNHSYAGDFGAALGYTERRQRRTCSICGKEQDKSVR